MKISVKHKDTEVIIDERGTDSPSSLMYDNTSVIIILNEIVEAINQIKK